jgi:hypothetical protein
MTKAHHPPTRRQRGAFTRLKRLRWRPGAHLDGTTVAAGFQPASDGRILASSPIATGGRDAALLAGWKPAVTVLVVHTRCARRPGWRAFSLAAIFALVLPIRAAIPPPEKLLPEETLIMLTVPDFAKLREIYRNSPQARFWNDPAMKPFRDKFIARWREEFVKPLERELGVSFDTYASLPQGQLTLALTPDNWQGKDDQLPGCLLLLDAKDKSDVLKTNLAALRQQWIAAGKQLRIEKIRNLEFCVFLLSSNSVPKTLGKFFPRPYEFQAPPGEVGSKKASGANDPAANNMDFLLDTIVGLFTGGSELVVGQADSLLLVGNSIKAVEKVASRLTGGAVPALGDLAAYQANHQALFRNAPLYGWVNVKAFVELLSRKPPEKAGAETPDPFDVIAPEKILGVTGVSGVKTLAFNLQDSSEGPLFQLFLGAPDASRAGIFRVLTAEAKEVNPPPFVPADAVGFQRWRLDGQKSWATLEKMLTDASSASLGTLNLILDTASARAKEKDPGFDLKKTLVGSLGDDIITYEKAPRGETPAELKSPPSILLLGSPSPDQLAAAIKALVVIFPQGDTLTEREFLGRKIFSVPMPAVPLFATGPPQSGPPRTLNFAATTGYVALSTDATLLEEYLRSSESKAKTLRERPGLAEAAETAGGLGTCLFGYENEAETMRAAFEAIKKDPASAPSVASLGLFPGIPGLGAPEKHFRGWMDFSLLPPFNQVAPYFHFTVYAQSANVDGLTLKFFAPVPPALRSNSAVNPAK